MLYVRLCIVLAAVLLHRLFRLTELQLISGFVLFGFLLLFCVLVLLFPFTLLLLSFGFHWRAPLRRPFSVSFFSGWSSGKTG